MSALDVGALSGVLERLGLGGRNSGCCTNGRWAPLRGGTAIEVLNPATGAPIALVEPASADDYSALLDSAVVRAAAWREVPAPRRGELVRLLGEALRQHKDDLGLLVTLENGKILTEGHGEVQEMIDIADFAVGQSRMLYGLSMHSERAQHRMMEQWHPLGVVGIISAFNFPVAVWAWNACLAAICGNVSLWKPSPKTPLTAIAVQQICNRVCREHGFPAVFDLFIDAGTTLAERFVADRRVALVSFTGSTTIGRRVGEVVAARLGRSLLELGGNNAVIIDNRADLALAIPSIVFGAVGTAGQRCTTTRRVFAPAAQLNDIERRLLAAYAQVRIGDPTDPATLMGPLIDASAVQRFEAAVTTAIAAGGTLLCGGRRLDRAGFFVEPAIVRARNDWDIVQHETFAPLLYLIPYDTLDDAIRMQNESAHGLSSALFTDSLSAAERFLSATGSDCGIANINLGTSGAEIGGAFGGEKDTGGGRESGSDAWRAYMRRQTNTVNWSGRIALAQGIRFDL